MAAELRHKWTPNTSFQEANSTVHWSWPEGENQHYWGYSVRPWQFNSDLEIVQQWTTTDNGNGWTENFLLRTFSGGLMRFSAIWVVGA